MIVRAKKSERCDVVDRDFHNIRELLEMLMTELAPTKHKLNMRPNLGWAPPTDVYETDKEFVITMDIAGMDRQQINIITDGQMLTIQGVRNEVAPQGKKQFHKLEIQVGPFQRMIPIPMPVDSQTISTDYSNGFLEVRLKKRPETKRQIKVE